MAFVWRAVLTLGLVLLYYCFSIGITFYNKWLTKVRGGPRRPLIFSSREARASASLGASPHPWWDRASPGSPLKYRDGGASGKGETGG